MARALAILSLVLLSLASAFSSANGAATRGSVSFSDLAPADEYFGRLKLSPFGIRHEIFTLKYDLYHARKSPQEIAQTALLVEDALHDWAGRFPRDPWIPSAAWNLATLYEGLHGADAHAHAVAALQFVRDRFAGSTYAAFAVRDLARAEPSAAPTAEPTSASTPGTPAALAATIRAQSDVAAAERLETIYRTRSHDGADPAYAVDAWELAALYERLPGETAQRHAIVLLALLLDRYPGTVYGRWALRDLARGVGVR